MKNIQQTRKMENEKKKKTKMSDLEMTRKNSILSSLVIRKKDMGV